MCLGPCPDCPHSVSTVQQSTLQYFRCSLWPSKHQRKLDVWQTKDSVTLQTRTCPSISLTSAVRTELYILECQPAHSAFPITRMLLCSCCSAWRLDKVQQEGRKTMSKRAFSIGLQHGANQRTGALSKRKKPEQNRIWRAFCFKNHAQLQTATH